MKKLFFFIFLTVLFLVYFFPVSAQEEKNNFSITPFFQEVVLRSDSGKTEFKLELSNQTENPAVFYLSVLDFGALDESGGVAFLGSSGDFENKYGLASWISLEKDAIAIGPGESQEISAFVENRESLSPGGHYGAVFFRIENDQKSFSQETQVSLRPSFAALIFVRKLGGEIFNLTLKEQQLNNHFWSLPDKARLRFQNGGNVHNVPRGTVILRDPRGREVSKGVINSESGIILPETFKVFPVPLEKRALAFIPGRYTLEASYRYDGKENFENAQSSLFIFPPLVWVILILVIFIIRIAHYFKIWKRVVGN